jgi:hypothetical protein
VHHVIELLPVQMHLPLDAADTPDARASKRRRVEAEAMQLLTDQLAPHRPALPAQVSAAPVVHHDPIIGFKWIYLLVRVASADIQY